ncbi:sulfatase-like hydrolase/transferase [Mycoplasmatota bacterium WC44]
MLTILMFFITIISIAQTLSIKIFLGVSSFLNIFDIFVVREMMPTYIKEFSLIYLLFFIPFLIMFGLSISRIRLKSSFRKRFIHLLLCITVILGTVIYSSTPIFSNEVETNTNYEKVIYFEELDAVSSRLGVTTLTIRSLYNEFLNKEGNYNLISNSNLLGQLESYLQNTNKIDNNYTDVLSGKNLIMIQVDNLDHIALNSDVMPTLTRLQNEGVFFRNYYSTYLIENGDTEFAVQTGVIPTDQTSNIRKFRRNGFSDSLVSLFNNLGYTTLTFYNDSNNYYSRNNFYYNLGYDLFLDASDLQLEKQKWQSSYEMINKTSSLYTSNSRFLVNYTLSSNIDYKFSNPLISNNYNDFEAMDVNDNIKYYYAASKEFDSALEYLLMNLRITNRINNTAIVIYGTHSPITMFEENLQELSNIDRGELNKFRAPLIIWTPSIDHNVVEEHIGPVDILPTLANMFGLSANYNNYIGVDIFSNGNNVVYFRNRSWVSNAGEYNSVTQKFVIRNEKYMTDFLKSYIKNTNEMIEEKFTYSRIILERNYFVQIKV